MVLYNRCKSLRRAGHNRTVITSRGEVGTGRRAGHNRTVIISRGEEGTGRYAGHNRTVIISRGELVDVLAIIGL